MLKDESSHRSIGKRASAVARLRLGQQTVQKLASPGWRSRNTGYGLRTGRLQRLEAYFERIGKVIGDDKRRASFATYAIGLLSDGERRAWSPTGAIVVKGAYGAEIASHTLTTQKGGTYTVVVYDASGSQRLCRWVQSLFHHRAGNQHGQSTRPVGTWSRASSQRALSTRTRSQRSLGRA